MANQVSTSVYCPTYTNDNMLVWGMRSTITLVFVQVLLSELMYIVYPLFVALNARLSIITEPEMPIFGSNFTLVCQVQTEELLQPSGMIFLQFPNGTVISDLITSATTTITLQLSSFTINYIGKYYCNVSITSPEFPAVGLRVFQAFIVENFSKY